MRAFIVSLVLALALAVACQIPERSYHVIEDGPFRGSDSASDAAPPATLRKLYFLVAGSGSSSGIFLLSKDGSGNLSVPAGITQPVASGSNSPVDILLGSDGRQLYSIESNGGSTQLAHFTIQADGTLVRLNDTLSLTTPGGRMALDPSGRWIAIAPGGTTVTIVTLDPTGKPLPGTSTPFQPSTNFRDVAFAQGGTCLLAISSALTTGTTTLNRLHGFPFSNGSVSTPTTAPAVITASRIAVHPNGSVAYVSNSQSSKVTVQAYSVASNCAVSLLGSAVMATDTGDAGLTADPAGAYLFATSNAVTRFRLASAGDLTLDVVSYLAQPNGYFDANAAMDPAVPDRLYVVGSGYNDGSALGGIAASIDGSGALTEVSHAYDAPLGGQAVVIVLAP